MSSDNSQDQHKPQVNSASYLKRNPRFNAIVLSLFVVGLSLGGYFIYSSFASEGPTDFNDKADVEAQAKALTSSVKLRSTKYANSRRNHSSDETKNKDTVAHVTAQRRLAMRKLMLTKPELASKYVLPDESKSNLPDEVKAQVETKVSLEGTWTTSMDERFDAKTGKIRSAKTNYSIHTKDASLNVVVAKVPDNVQHLDTVKLSGVTIDGMVAVDKDGLNNKQLSEETNQKIASLPTAAKMLGVEPVRAATTSTAITPYNPPATGTKNIAVYMVNFKNDLGKPSIEEDPDPTTGASPVVMLSQQALQKYFVTDTNSVANYYKVQSTSMFTPNITVHDWYTSSANNNVDCTDYAAGLLTDSFLASIGSAVDSRDKTATPNTRVFIFNRLQCTNSTTLGAVANANFPKPITGDIPMVRYVQSEKGATKQGFTRVVAHELGHTLGLQHANKDTSQCTTNCTADNPVFRDREYGDIYDVMGKGLFGESSYFNGYHQYQLGWLKRKLSGNAGRRDIITGILPADIAPTAPSSWDVNLLPIETKSSYAELSNSQYQKIAAYQAESKTYSGNEYLYLEYRQKIVGSEIFDGFKKYSSLFQFDKAVDAEPGVIIYKANVPNLDNTGLTTRLLNPIKGSQDFSKGHILRTGQTYEDTINRVKFSFIGTGTSSPNNLSTAKVHVEYTKDMTPPAKPTNITIIPFPGSAEATWKNPTDGDYSYSKFNIYKVDGLSTTKFTCAGNSRNSTTVRANVGCVNGYEPTKYKYYFTMQSIDRWSNISAETDKIEFKPQTLPALSYSVNDYKTSQVTIAPQYIKKGATLGISIKWPAIPNATSYIVRRSDGKEFETPNLLNTFNDNTVQPFYFYTYTIFPKLSGQRYYPMYGITGICTWRAERYEWLCGQGGQSFKYGYIYPDPTQSSSWELL